MSKILSKEQLDSLNKLDWFLIASEREIDKITSFFDRLYTLDKVNKRLVDKYRELFLFKIKQSYQLMLDIEEDVYNSSFDCYKQHYGLFRNKNNFLEQREMSLSYKFEGLITQLKTMLDFLIKFVGELRLNSSLGKMDSFETITRKFEAIKFKDKNSSEYKNAKNKLELYKKEQVLKEIFKNFENLYSLKGYRDFAVHRGVIPQDKYVSFEGKIYLSYNYSVPKITNSGRNYRVNKKYLLRLDYFCRLRFLEMIYVIWKTLSNLIDDKLIKGTEMEFSDYNPRLVREVLRFLGRKTIFNDKSMIKEKELKKILQDRGFKFEDLIVEDTNIQRMNDGMKSVDNKDMSYALKRTLFKPLGYFQVNKIENIYDRDWIPPKQLGIMYGIVDLSFEIKEIKKPKGNVKKIIDSLTRLGLIIKLKDEGRYTIVDQDLQNVVGNLMSLSQFKWSFINNPNFSYFRGLNEFEKENFEMIFGSKAKENIKRVDEDRKKVSKDSDFYKMEIKFLEDSKTKYLDMLNNQKGKMKKIINKKYNYLIPALKLINEDFFLKNPNLD